MRFLKIFTQLIEIITSRNNNNQVSIDDETVELLKICVKELKRSVREQKRLFWLTIIITVLTIGLFIFTYQTLYIELKKTNNEEKQRKEDITLKKWTDFKQGFLGDSGVFYIVVGNDTSGIQKRNEYLTSILNYFEDMNNDYIRGELDLQLIDRQFHPYIGRLVRNVYVNTYINQVRLRSIGHRPSDSLAAGSFLDAIYIWAKRTGIEYNDSLSAKWEKFYYVDEAPTENFFPNPQSAPLKK